MKTFIALLIGTGLLLTLPSFSLAAPYGQWQRYGNAADYGNSYDPLRSVINQTQNDLRYAAGLERQKGDPHARYSEAQGHLSTFDRKLTQGRFDQSELKKSIDKIHAILNKNVLQSNSRDALLRDMDQLERARYSRY